MTIKELQKILLNYDEDTQVIVSEAQWIDKKDYIYGVVDNPITGISYTKDTECNELRLFFQSDLKKFSYIKTKDL